MYCVALPAERLPAGRKLLQHADGAAAEAERRADRLRQPPDGGEERPKEPHAPPGGGGAALPAGRTRSRRQCEFFIAAPQISFFGFFTFEINQLHSPLQVSGSRWGAASKADTSSLMFSQEREAWTRERTRLEKALHQAQAQLARLRAEIRADTVREVTGPEADNAALKVRQLPHGRVI